MKQLLIFLLISFSFAANLYAAEFENISTRGPVGKGSDLIHAGFVVNEPGNIQVLVKVAGPSLPPDLNGLQDPFVRLFNAADGSLIHQNDNWQTDPSAGLVEATGLAPTNPKEPAFVITLPRGSYTAVVNGVNDTTGTAITSATKVDVGTGPKPPNQIKTEELIGNWLFVSQIDGQPFEDIYKLVSPSFERNGTYFINGTDMFNDPVVAGYIPEDTTYGLLDQFTSFDQVFLFDFTNSEDTVSGCLFIVLIPSDEVSPCFQMEGTRSLAKSTLLSVSQNETEEARLTSMRSATPRMKDEEQEKLLDIYYRLKFIDN